MIDVVGLVITLSICALIGFLAYNNFRLIVMNVKQSNELKQSAIDNLTYLKQIGDLIEQQQKNELTQTDGFVSFVSKSRDWAFTYIEEVQSALKSFVETVGPVLAYYDKYGRISESESMNKIFDAYQELIKILPETENKQGETK